MLAGTEMLLRSGLFWISWKERNKKRVRRVQSEAERDTASSWLMYREASFEWY